MEAIITLNDLANNLALARHYLNVDQPAQAISVLDRSAGTLLHDPEYWYLRCQALHDLERYSEAAQVARVGLGNDPHNVYLLYIYCNCLSNLGDLPGAEQAILAALRIYPDEPGFLSRYALLVAEAGQLDKAMRLVYEASRIAPNHPAVMSAQALIAYLSGDDKRMGQVSKEMLREDAEDALGHYLLGVHNAVQGNVSTAARHARNAVQLDPRNKALVTAARESMFSSHWLLWPLRLFSRFGPAKVWFAAIGTSMLLRKLGLREIAFIFSVTYLLLCIYSWVVPPVLKWWLERR